MIEKCFNAETKIFLIKVDSLIKFNEVDVDKFNLIAKNISNETGVPKELIYTAPYFFFIDRWHKIDNQWYFYKSNDYDFYFINELLGEVISEYFGLETVHYKIAQLCVNGENKGYGLASKNFCNPKNTYKRSWDYGFNPMRDLSILQKIKDICSTEKEYLILLSDIKKFFIRDFYTSQLDRSGNNFLFKVDTSGIRLAPLYDHENSFEATDKYKYRNQIGELDITNPDTRKILLTDDKFQELLNLLMDTNISVFIELVENSHKILVPNDIKDYYLKNDSEIKKLVLKHKIIK